MSLFRFIYVEAAFFERWWHQQTDSVSICMRSRVFTAKVGINMFVKGY
jgi:hypothetical protein